MRPTEPGPAAWWVMIASALAVGLIAGYGAVVFRAMITAIHNLFFLGRLSFDHDANLHSPEPIAVDRTRLVARLDWNRQDLLAIFPFPHHVELAATLAPGGLTMETALRAGREGPVPVSFGFHPYLGLSGLPRADWRLALPAMRRLALDERGIPIGEERPFGGFDAALGKIAVDDGFALPEEEVSMSLAGAGRRITVELVAGYRYAQVFAPADKDYVALEPMTAPANALRSGRGLRLVEPGGTFRATFRIRVEETG